MRTLSLAVCLRVVCGAVVAAAVSGPLLVSAQEPAAEAAPALERIKDRLERPTTRRLTPREPVQLRPTFRSRVIDRPFVPTLQEDLRKTFALTDFQRQYAEYAARCCGADLGALFRYVDRALDERRVRKAREQIARELAAIEAARVR